MTHTYEEYRETLNRTRGAWERGEPARFSDREREIMRERAAADPVVSEMLRKFAAGLTPEDG